MVQHSTKEYTNYRTQYDQKCPEDDRSGDDAVSFNGSSGADKLPTGAVLECVPSAQARRVDSGDIVEASELWDCSKFQRFRTVPGGSRVRNLVQCMCLHKARECCEHVCATVTVTET